MGYGPRAEFRVTMLALQSDGYLRGQIRLSGQVHNPFATRDITFFSRVDGIGGAFFPFTYDSEDDVLRVDIDQITRLVGCAPGLLGTHEPWRPSNMQERQLLQGIEAVLQEQKEEVFEDPLPGRRLATKNRDGYDEQLLSMLRTQPESVVCNSTSIGIPGEVWCMSPEEAYEGPLIQVRGNPSLRSKCARRSDLVRYFIGQGQALPRL
ncbi:hypothetical protein HYS48_01170 [Candidatus Woesearchaeota archaeon]|nr:hypothetical protein [Candidatus Woesearchaeota archaeon]